jgi:hypothetical protein
MLAPISLSTPAVLNRTQQFNELQWHRSRSASAHELDRVAAPPRGFRANLDCMAVLPPSAARVIVPRPIGITTVPRRLKVVITRPMLTILIPAGRVGRCTQRRSTHGNRRRGQTNRYLPHSGARSSFTLSTPAFPDQTQAFPLSCSRAAQSPRQSTILPPLNIQCIPTLPPPAPALQRCGSPRCSSGRPPGRP